MKIVAIGGGTGLPVLLSGLRSLRSRGECEVHITALVAVSDSGGSTGELRRALGIPAVGDLRNCFIALSESQAVLNAVCTHRFEKLEDFSGHSVGNVILAALYELAGNFEGMVRLGGQLFQLKDSVFPITNSPVTLCAEYLDGCRVYGEANIPLQRKPLRRIWLDPENPLPSAGVLEAIAAADVITFGPGSLFTSIIPNLLVADIADAIHASPALKIYICNLMTQTGETEHFDAADHLRALKSYLPSQTVDVCLMNRSPITPVLREKYAQAGSHLVEAAAEPVARLGVTCDLEQLLDETSGKIRHDQMALARRIVAIPEGRQEWEVLCAES